MVMGLVSGLSLANHSDSESFLVVHTLFSQDGCKREGFWEVVRYVVSFWPFLNSSSWWWLISCMLLTRTSCGKTTHVNDYYGAWPGWAVSVSVIPLILLSSSLMLEISHLDSHSITLPFFASLKSHSLHFLGRGSTWRLVSHLHFSTKRSDMLPKSFSRRRTELR